MTRTIQVIPPTRWFAWLLFCSRLTPWDWLQSVRRLTSIPPEAGTIAPRLATAASEQDLLQIIYDEFQAWFGEDAGAEGRYKGAARAVWLAIVSRQARMLEARGEC